MSVIWWRGDGCRCLMLILMAGAAVTSIAGCADEIDRAAQRGDVVKVKGILDAHPDLVDARGHHDVTPLQLAALSGQMDVVKLLLERGAKVDAQDRSGWTALHYAATQGREEVVAALIAHHADVNAKDDKGETPLHWAKAGGHEDVVALLQAHGGQ